MPLDPNKLDELAASMDIPVRSPEDIMRAVEACGFALNPFEAAHLVKYCRGLQAAVNAPPGAFMLVNEGIDKFFHDGDFYRDDEGRFCECHVPYGNICSMRPTNRYRKVKLASVQHPQEARSGP